MSRTKPEASRGKSVSTPATHPETSPQPATTEADAIIFSIRGTPEWREWLRRFAAHQRVTPTALVDQALAEVARRVGFVEPPPRHRASNGRTDGHAAGPSNGRQP